MLMPAFHRHPAEAAIIGRLLAGFGELEFIFAILLGHILRDRDKGLRAYFRQLTARGRISMADALVYSALHEMKLGNEYGTAYGALLKCHGMRNRLAHSHWADWHDYPGLFFTNVEDAAKGHGPVDYPWLHMDEPLLKQWEDYFFYTQQCLTFLQERARYRQEKLRSRPPYDWPGSSVAPPEHNPPEEHSPPWLPLKTDFPPEAPVKKLGRGAKRKRKADRKAKWKKPKKKRA